MSAERVEPVEPGEPDPAGRGARPRGVATVLTLPEPRPRPRMFDRLPAVFRDPARFRPAQVQDAALPGGTDWVTPDDMIGVGSEGWRIQELQRALARARHDPGPPDGSFGPRTEDAVRSFQRQRGLTVDGLVGPQTMSELEAPLLRRFLDGLEDVLDPILEVLDNLPAYASVDTAPDDFLRWLAWMVGADTMEEWDRGRRRAVVARSLELHGSRGTLPGIAAVVALQLGVAVSDVVVRDGGETSWDLDPDAPLRTDPDRRVTVSLPPHVPPPSGPALVRIMHVLSRSLPVGFVVDFTSRGSPGTGGTTGGWAGSSTAGGGGGA